MPQIEPYDGSTDPIDHLESYKAVMMIQETTDTLLCIDFLTIIRKATRAWYFGLQSGSINSFEQLEHSFVAHFSTSRKVPRISDSLFSIKQDETETLRDFMAHFNTAVLEVRDLNENMAISTMKRGLRESRFTYSLDKTLPRTYAELLVHAYKYIYTDEAASDRWQIDRKDQKKKQKKSETLIESNRPTINKRASPRWWSLKSNNYSKYDSYTPFSTLHI